MYLVVLCGGAGTRLWPVSRSGEPKQFLELPADTTLLVQTLARAASYGITRPPIIVCSADHGGLVRALLARNGIEARIVLEPARRNTAPAIAAAAALVEAEDPGALMLVTPADHFMADTAPFGAAVAQGRAHAEAGAVVTFGITPRAASSSYGYIEMGEALSRTAHHVARFVEKPPPAVAEEFVRSGRFVWNSGIFLFRAATVLAELDSFAPEIAKRARAAVAGADIRAGALTLAPEPFGAAPATSIDYAVMEHTKKAVVLPVTLEWSDLGTWDAIWEVLPKDKAGNVTQGDVMALDCRNTLLRGNGRLVAALGLSDMIVVDTPDALLVTPRARAQDVTAVVNALHAQARPEADEPPVVTRPWGTYQTVYETPNYKVKRLCIFPGAAISLQYHHRRTEYWTIVGGTGVLTLDRDERTLGRGDTAFIPVGAHHRLRNPGSDMLEFVEVQIGDYLGEDDIVRISDDYGRA